MTRDETDSLIQSHTEYVRSRSRCPGCGELIPKRAGAGGLCNRCST